MRALTFAVLCLGACADLPNIAARECGNSVIDPGENCDTIQLYPGASCRAPNTIGECHLDCRRQPSGMRASCPAGWACDPDDLCREPSGNFVPPSAPARVGGASVLIAADFDGDGRGEIVSRSLPNEVGEAVFRLHHFDVNGTLDDTRGFERRVGALSFADLSGDGREDIVFPLFGVGLVRGQPDRSLVPETFSPNPIAGSGLRQVSLARGQVDGQSGVVYLTAVQGTAGLYVVDAVPRLSMRGPMHGSVDALAGEPASASVVEGDDSPCRELIHGFRGESVFYVSDLCTRDATGLHWRNEVLQATVALAPPAGLTLGPQVADLDRDGHSDVLIGTDAGPYVAYGDGKVLQTAVPFQLALANPEQVPPQIEMPLAIADLSGDGAPDFVMPQRILASSTLPNATLPRYDVTFRNPGAPWSVAKIDDLTGNGEPDVIAAAATGSGVDFFSGTGTPVLIATSIPTAGPVAHLASGDFDGDTLNDLVFVEQRPRADLPDLINIAYGRAFEPPRAAVIAARIPSVQQVATHTGIGLVTHIALSSLRTTQAGFEGTLTWLFGSPDRLPISVVNLLTFADTGSLVDSRALALAAGAFTSAATRDVIAFAFAQRTQVPSFWLLPELASLSARVQQVPGSFDPRLMPAQVRADGSYRNQLAGTSAQLDSELRDETVWAMPADQGQRCALAIAGLQLEPAPLVVMRNTLFFDFACLDPQIAAVDLDGDQQRDLVLLGGSRGAGDRKLVVLWNDAGFANERSTLIDGISPQAFAVLAKPGALSTLAVVTTSGLFTIVQAPARTFAPALKIMALQQGTGLAASDVTGDGLLDLVVADAGDVSVYRAEWKP
jgi:hypothetical protein